MKVLFATFLFWALAWGNGIAQTYNIKNFNAVADGKTLNTQAIQTAIDQCNKDGGGEVIVPAGVYLTGTLFLKSNVYLHLMPGSVLQGSYNPKDYPEYNISAAKKFGTITHNGLYIQYLKAVVIADRAVSTGIWGEGILKGAGEGAAFQLGLNKDGKPMNILFIGCKDVTLKGIKIMNSCQVTVLVSNCEKVTIDGIRLNSLVNWNCDGLDVDGRDITISNCVIDSEDDALCFKSEYFGQYCENITVTNCILSSVCNGIKFGTGSRTGFRNISVSNCIIKKSASNGYHHWKMTPDIVYQDTVSSVNSGIAIEGVDGGLVENISLSHITMTDVISPVFIRIGRRFLNPNGKPSVMRHIRIQDIIVESRSIIPSIIAGLADSPVEDVMLSNFSIYIPITVGADSLKSFPSVIPENETDYPENQMFGRRLPVSVFFIRHVDGVVIRDISVKYGTNEARPAFYLDDAKRVVLKNISINNKPLEKSKTLLKTINSDRVDFGLY